MTLCAASVSGFLGGWTTGCLVLLVGVWLFLALLGIRNTRFPWRLAGGAVFVVGSALWLGLHPTQASRWEVDSGYLGFAAQTSLLGAGGASSFLVNLVGALLAACSVIGLLIAVDWLPLVPFAPLLATVEGRLARAADRRAAARAARAEAPALPSLVMKSSSATLEPPRAAAPMAPLVPPAPAPEPPPVTVAETESIVAAAEEAVADVPQPTTWSRFRPLARPVESEPLPAENAAENAVDNEAEATHNPLLAEGESRSDEGASPDASEVAPGSAAEESQSLPAEPAPAIESELTERKDPPVLEPVAELEVLTIEEVLPVNAEAEATVADVADVADGASSETLAPRRKKEEEPAEVPGEEPAEEPGEEPGEEEEEGDDFEEGDDEEEWEDDEEEEDEEKEEEEDVEEEEDDEEWDDEEEGDEEEDDEEEDDDKEDDKEDDKDDDKDDEEWDDDEERSRAASEPAAESTIAAVDAPIDDVPIAEAPEVEILAEAPASEAPAVEAPAPAAAAPAVAAPAAPATLPKSLFRDAPDDERELLARACELLVGLESVSLSKLQRELAITYYSAARVFERLEKEGFIAPYSGSLARSIKLTRAEWEARLRA